MTAGTGIAIAFIWVIAGTVAILCRHYREPWMCLVVAAITTAFLVGPL